MCVCVCVFSCPSRPGTERERASVGCVGGAPAPPAAPAPPPPLNPLAAYGKREQPNQKKKRWGPPPGRLVQQKTARGCSPRSLLRSSLSSLYYALGFALSLLQSWWSEGGLRAARERCERPQPYNATSAGGRGGAGLLAAPLVSLFLTPRPFRSAPSLSPWPHTYTHNVQRHTRAMTDPPTSTGSAHPEVRGGGRKVQCARARPAVAAGGLASVPPARRPLRAHDLGVRIRPWAHSLGPW